MNNKIKKLINEKNSGYKSYCRFNRDVFLFEKFKFIHNQLSVSIENSMQRYYSSKLANPATNSKTYWSIFKIFLSNKKTPCIPPLFHENRLITNFKKKAKLFNIFFANQCTLLTNNSVFPNNLEN